MPSPIVFSDVNYLSTTAPPAAAEWANLLRPLRGREPEGIWNLLSIVRELFRRRDRNALALLQVWGEARGRRRSVGVVGEGRLGWQEIIGWVAGEGQLGW